MLLDLDVCQRHMHTHTHTYTITHTYSCTGLFTLANAICKICSSLRIDWQLFSSRCLFSLLQRYSFLACPVPLAIVDELWKDSIVIVYLPYTRRAIQCRSTKSSKVNFYFLTSLVPSEALKAKASETTKRRADKQRESHCFSQPISPCGKCHSKLIPTSL